MLRFLERLTGQKHYPINSVEGTEYDTGTGDERFAEVTAVTLSADGRYAFSGDSTGVGRLWNVGTGRCVQRLLARDGSAFPIRCARLSHDGRYALLGSEGPAGISLWDDFGGRCFLARRRVRSFGFSRSGRYSLTDPGAGTGGWSLSLTDLLTNESRYIDGGRGRVAAALSEDDQYVLVAARGEHTTLLRVLDVRTRRCLNVIESKDGVDSVAWVVDGHLALSGQCNGKCRLWDVKTGKECQVGISARQHTLLSFNNGYSWTPNGGPWLSEDRCLALSADSESMRLWEVQTGNVLQVFRGHRSWVNSACFSADGGYILTGSRDCTVRLWRTRSGRCVRVFGGPASKWWKLLTRQAHAAVRGLCQIKNLFARANSQGAPEEERGVPDGAVNLAAVLEHLGNAGRISQLAALLDGLGERGESNYACLLNQATSAEAREVSRWLEGATSDEIRTVAGFLNGSAQPDVGPVMSLIRLRRGTPRVTRKSEVPTYSEVKEAVVRGDARAVLAFLSDGFDVNACNEHGETMLLHALCMGDARLAIAELLVGHGADVNATVHGKTLLRFIRDPAYCDNERTIAFLLREGATEGDETNSDDPPLPRTAKPDADAEMIRFECPACGNRLKAAPRDIGKRAKCRACNHRMQVPAPIRHDKVQADAGEDARRESTASGGWSAVERLAAAAGSVRLAQNPGLESSSVLHVGVLVFREGEYPPPDEQQYCRDVARLKYGRTPDHLEAGYCVGVRPGSGLDYAYALGLYGRLRETGRLPDLGDLKDHFAGSGPDGQRVVALFF